MAWQSDPSLLLDESEEGFDPSPPTEAAMVARTTKKAGSPPAGKRSSTRLEATKQPVPEGEDPWNDSTSPLTCTDTGH